MSAANLPAEDQSEGPWNPGLSSDLTRELLALTTIFRPENAWNGLTQAIELRDVTGLRLDELAIFRPERLALHEIILRVTADYEISDPEDSGRGLGRNLRGMTQTLYGKIIDAHRQDLSRLYGESRTALEAFLEGEIASSLRRPSQRLPDKPSGFWAKLRASAAPRLPPAPESQWERDERVLRRWTALADSSEPSLHAAGFRSLAKVASAVRSRHGRIVGEDTFLGPLATDLACNEHAAETIGRYLDPIIDRIAGEQGFRRLPAQARPVAMVTKGASASGKTTMRPLQRKLAARMGIPWSDFALISPDTWRKVLLDYGSLGRWYKYAGMLTSQEVTIIDRKLDGYLVSKGEHGRISHMLIDRFRFDSFALDSAEARHLASRFGDLLCYFFMITPPHLTVERAWKRGLEVGRYKAVDDLLAHNVEAFTGMQNMLFGRALDPKIRVHYELLDNDVPRGRQPLTVAFGWSGEMNVLDLRGMLDMERHRKINVDAKNPTDVYDNKPEMEARNSARFLARCVREFPVLNFADRDSGRIYARLESGRPAWVDAEALAAATMDREAESALMTAAPDLFRSEPPRLESAAAAFLDPERYCTIGRWGRLPDMTS